jgi:phosphonate transport system ATP-binding protein
VAALVSIRDLVKTYPTGTRALDGISLDFHKGEFIVLIGLSGSGKSTLLRCINRLVDPTSGTVTFDGADVTRAKGTELRRIRRRIGMIFQQFNLVKRSSVFTNVLAGRLGYRTTWRTIAGRPTRDDVALAFENLGRVGIVEKAFGRADALSGGQQQRVGIARALMQRPELMLADEPVASLDPDATEEVMVLLRSLAADEGMAVVCVLHQPELARWHADRIVGLRAGRIVVDAPATEVDDAALTRLYRGHASSG